MKFCTVPVTTLEDGVRNPDAAGFFPDYAVKVLLSLLRSEGDVVNPSQMLEKIEGVHTEQDTVDWLKIKGIVMDVDDFCQCVAGRMILQLLFGQGAFEIIVVQFCGSKASCCRRPLHKQRCLCR